METRDIIQAFLGAAQVIGQQNQLQQQFLINRERLKQEAKDREELYALKQAQLDAGERALDLKAKELDEKTRHNQETEATQKQRAQDLSKNAAEKVTLAREKAAAAKTRDSELLKYKNERLKHEASLAQARTETERQKIQNDITRLDLEKQKFELDHEFKMRTLDQRDEMITARIEDMASGRAIQQQNADTRQMVGEAQADHLKNSDDQNAAERYLAANPPADLTPDEKPYWSMDLKALQNQYADTKAQLNKAPTLDQTISPEYKKIRAETEKAADTIARVMERKSQGVVQFMNAAKTGASTEQSSVASKVALGNTGMVATPADPTFVETQTRLLQELADPDFGPQVRSADPAARASAAQRYGRDLARLRNSLPPDQWNAYFPKVRDAVTAQDPAFMDDIANQIRALNTRK